MAKAGAPARNPKHQARPQLRPQRKIADTPPQIFLAKLAEPEEVEEEPQAMLPTPGSVPPAPKPKAKGPEAPFLEEDEEE